MLTVSKPLEMSAPPMMMKAPPRTAPTGNTLRQRTHEQRRLQHVGSAERPLVGSKGIDMCVPTMSAREPSDDELQFQRALVPPPLCSGSCG